MKLKELFENKKSIYIHDIHQNDYQLTSLEDIMPDEYTETLADVDISKNHLTNLLGSPTRVGGYFNCEKNKLTSLEGAPKEIGFHHRYPLTEKIFNCYGNDNLKTLEGGPEEVKGSYSASRCGLTSLQGVANKISGNLDVSLNELTSLQGIHKLFKNGYINGEIAFDFCPIKSHILGLLLIPKLQGAHEGSINKGKNDNFSNALEIINRHLASDRDVIDCQQELIEAGLKEFAQL